MLDIILSIALSITPVQEINVNDKTPVDLVYKRKIKIRVNNKATIDLVNKRKGKIRI